MCEMSEERTYYIRTSLMYTDLTREVLFKVFKYLIKSEDITGFLSSLEQQNILKELFKKNVINRYDYDLVSGQVLNLERLDISLLIRLILNLCKDNIPKPQRGLKTKPQPKDESLCADLLRLRDVRNKIIGHRADAKLSEAEYEKTWAKIKAILLRVVELVDSTSRENCERRINEYRRLNVDTENAEVKRLLDELLKYKEEFDHLQEKVEELSRTSNEFQVYFRLTPERFVRYIKLLFNGGRIVLCGILEKKLGDQDLSEFLEKKKETLTRNIGEKFSSCLYPQQSCSDYKNWDVFLLASVLLLTFDNDLSQNEIMYIGLIKSARVNYTLLALQSLDTDAFLTSWTDLINCLNHLSINIAEDDKQQVERLIELYKKKGEEGCDVDVYLKQLRESGVEVKTLNDVYNETITELKDILNQLNQKHIKFKEEHVLEFNLLTTCENKEIKKRAEDLLEINLQASMQNLDQPSYIVRGETDKLVASIAAHPDVKPYEVKRKCIILAFKCSTPGGLLHILNTTQGDKFRSTFRNIANELHYIYGYAFLIQGNFTLESVSRISRMISKSTTNEASSEHISIPLKCSSVDGICSVLSAIKRGKTTNILNRIAEQMSEEFKETVSIKLIPEMMEFRNVFEDTDSEGSSSLGRNEHETEEGISSEIANENDNGNQEEQADFIIDNILTLAHPDVKDKEVIRGHGDDVKNEVYAAQQSDGEKMKEYAAENKKSAWNIETMTDTLQTIYLGQTCLKDVTVGEKRTGSKLGYKNDNGNQDEQTEFITDNKLTLVHPNETHFELVPKPTDDKKNESSAAQESFDEKMKECETEYEEKGSIIKTISNAFLSFIDVIADYDKTPTRRPDVNQFTSMNKDKDNLKKFESRCKLQHMYTQQMYTHRGFQRESDKLKESIKMGHIYFAGNEGEMKGFPWKSIEVDVREKQYEDTMKKTGTHDNDIDFETEDPTLLSKDEFERVLLEAETSCKILTEYKTVITESKLLILQDEIEYLIQASKTAAATSFQRQNLDSVRKSFLNIKKMFLDWVAFHDMENEDMKEDFQSFVLRDRGMYFGYNIYKDASLDSLDGLYLYSHEGERIRSEKDIFYQRGSLSKNIVVSGLKSSCTKLCGFLEENCSRHANWPGNEFKYVFRLSLRYEREKHIHDMIKDQILWSRCGDLPCFEQVLFREADKCLIILEDLDKWKPFEDMNYDLNMVTRWFSTARRKDQLPKRNHMTDYVVLVTTEDENIENIKLGETDRLLYLKDSDSDSDTLSQLVSQGEKNVQLDRGSNPGSSRYRSAVLSTEPSSYSLHNCVLL